MTVKPQLTATGDAQDRLHVEFSRLPCDEGHSASCRAGAGKSAEICGVDGHTATGLDTGLRKWQEGHAEVEW